MTYGQIYNQIHGYVHANEVYIVFQCEEEQGFSHFPIADAQEIEWDIDIKDEPYYAIGDDIMPSEHFRHSYLVTGKLTKLVMRKHPEVPEPFIALGTKIILGQTPHESFPSLLFPYNSVRLRIYAFADNKGYELSRIIFKNVKGGIREGEFMQEVIQFTALLMEPVDL